MPAVVNEIVQTDFEVEIQARINAERARLRAAAGLARMREFKKPMERTFTAAERDVVTILFGGLTWKHEEMIKAVFHGSGYRCDCERSCRPWCRDRWRHGGNRRSGHSCTCRLSRSVAVLLLNQAGTLPRLLG